MASHHFSNKLGHFAVCCMAIAGLGQVPAYAQSGKKLVTETRVFRVSVDGKDRGQCTIAVDGYDDGTDKVHVDASVKVDYLANVYRYQSTGNEIWKNGQLQQLDNIADFNGSRFHLDGKTGTKTFRLAVDGVNTDFPADSWPTSYWQIPGPLVTAVKKAQPKVAPTAGTKATPGTKSTAVVKPKVATLLDTDKGQKLNGGVQFVGNEKLKVAGNLQACDHYRIADGVQVELWYDNSNRLVRQQSLDSGHKTLLEMTQLAIYRYKN